MPFITWEFQDDSILKIVEAIDGQHDLLIEKGRDMGATVMILGVMLWKFLFHDDCSFLLGSNKQETVDKKGNHKALFQKLDAYLEKLPLFLKHPVDIRDEACRTKNNLLNRATGASIDGEATVANFGRGDRRTAVMIDEFAQWEDGMLALKATADVTPCRLINSTHQGSHTAFYHYSQRCEHKLSLPWWLHPVKAIGLYKTAEGQWRSPAFDEESKRRTPREMAEEWEIDVEGAAGQFFDVPTMNRLIRESRRPFHAGEVHWNRNQHRLETLQEKIGGRYRFWFPLGPVPTLPGHARYVIGGDVSLGTGSTNSVLAVWNRLTLERVADFVDNETGPAELADIAVVLSKFFNDALFIWDVQGAGKVTAKRLVSLGFSNVWYAVKSSDSAMPMMSDRPGFVMTPATKLQVLSEYSRALYTGDAQNPCEQALKECLQFINTDNGPEHSKALMRAQDPTGEGKFHGDLVIADALAWHVLEPNSRLSEPVREELNKPAPTMSTFAGRREIYWKQLAEQEQF